MKTLIIAALALALAGCSNPGTGDGSADPVATVQLTAEKICGYVPTASSVAAMLSANNPAVVGAAAIAQAICNAVTKKAAAPDGACPQVNGVCVEGEFKKKD